MIRQISMGLAILGLGTGGPVLACSIAPPPLMTAEEKAAASAKVKQAFIDQAKTAPAILHVRAIRSSGANESNALFEVSRSYQGKSRNGRVLRLKTLGLSLCGAGGVKRREQGIIILSASEPTLFNGFLRSGDIEILQQEGILPAKLLK